MGFKDKMAEMRDEAARQQELAKERRAAPGGTVKASFEGVKVANERITQGNTGGPLSGAHARVESGADVRQRMTATRTVMLGGIGGILFKKQAGHVFLTIEHPEYDIVVEVPAKKEADARKFASKVNNAAK